MGYQINNDDVGHPASVASGGTETSDPVDVSDQNGQATLYWDTSGDGVIETSIQGSCDGGSTWFDIETIDGQTKKKQTESGVLSSNSKGELPKFDQLRLQFDETGGSSSKSIDDVRALY